MLNGVSICSLMHVDRYFALAQNDKRLNYPFVILRNEGSLRVQLALYYRIPIDTSLSLSMT
jgi:hypothetical protein